VKLVSTTEMQQVEREANANGLSYEIMMQNAGTGLAEQILTRFNSLKEKEILGLVGSGNNGGDTLVALAKMAEAGWSASAYLARSRAKDDPLIEHLVAKGGMIVDAAEDEKFKQLKSLIKNHSIIMDGVLGTGIQLPLRGTVKTVLETVRKLIVQLESKPVIVAVDCPSGIDCDSGEAAAECLAADLTVTMAAVKQGMLRFPANNLIGELSLVGIGLRDQDERSPIWQGIKREIVTAQLVNEHLPVRARDAHKGTFGTALIIAGSLNFTGAALLAGKAAYRAGVGLVTTAVPAPLHCALAGQFAEGTWLLLPHEMGVIADSAAEVVLENLGNASAILIGPGFGQEDTTQNFLSRLLSESPGAKQSRIGFVAMQEHGTAAKKRELAPMVIDADGLKLLSKISGWMEKFSHPAILTPHPGEMAVLTGLGIGEIQENRLEIAERYANEWGHVVVLKGANTVVAEPGGRTALVPIATPALARAGSGDVLAGVITSLRAQGLGAYEAAICGTWMHAQSGLLAAESLGTNSSVLAGDLVNALPEVFKLLGR